MQEHDNERRLAPDDLLTLATYAGLKFETAEDLHEVGTQLQELIVVLREWERDGLGLTLTDDGATLVRPVIVDRAGTSASGPADT